MRGIGGLLEDITVVDFPQMVAGSFAGLQLVELGVVEVKITSGFSGLFENVYAVRQVIAAYAHDGPG